jgi:urease accessory protein UreE
VIIHQFKTNTAAPVQAKLLPHQLGNRHLPFAGDGATAGLSHGEALPWWGITLKK